MKTKISFHGECEAETEVTPKQIELLRSLAQAGWIQAWLNLDMEGTNVKVNVLDVRHLPEPITLEEARRKK